MRYNIYWFLKCHVLCLMFSPWVLVSGQIRYSVPEELQPRAFVGNIAADLDIDGKLLSARGMRIAPSSRNQYFGIHLESGILFVKEIIDREQLCGSNLDCRLSFDVVVENPLTLYQVEVEILDVNDNAPSFPKSQFRLEIYESAAPGMRFPLERAHDPDIGSNALQTYDLQPNKYFILDQQTSSWKGRRPILSLQRSFDRESAPIHNLTLTAKDGGTPPRSGTVQIMVIVQDVNDNSPVFSQSVYRVSLFENAPKGSLIIRLNATDLDEGANGEIRYFLSSHISTTARKLFDVNPKTGEIRLKGHLDYEESSAIEINIQAVDKGSGAIPQYCDVLLDIIDVNDNAPEVTFGSLSKTVSEDATLGTVVALFTADDRDSGQNGEVHCQLLDQLPFKLDSSLKRYFKIIVQQSLDRESNPKYDITITCTDSGNPPLTSRKTFSIEVSDINDNAPKFSRSEYTANIQENNEIGASLLSITAFDPDVGGNAKLGYSILQSQVENSSINSFVSMNSATGVLYAQRVFDYEQLKHFQIQVEVRDSGTPTLSSNASVNVVILDQNDNAPVIKQPAPEHGSIATETVSRLAEPGYLVLKVSATDSDAGQNSRLSYHIFQATSHNLFTISADSGEIWIIRRILSKEASSQRLVIAVKDHGIPSLSATMTVVLSLVETGSKTSSSVSQSSADPRFRPELSFVLVIAFGSISIMFLAIVVILAIKVHKNRNGVVYHHRTLSTCCCFETGNSLVGIQTASESLQIPSNYIEVFGGDPLSQRFRYESCSTLQSTKRGFIVPNIHRTPADKNCVVGETTAEESAGILISEKSNVHEVRDNIHWLVKYQLFGCLFGHWILVSAQIRYSVPEELQAGAFVGNIAIDLGLGLKQLSARSLRVALGPRKRYVDVNLENGLLFVNERIDREQLCGSSNDCVLSLSAVLEDPLSLHQVEVEILDVNDNAPSFPKSQVRLEISEIMTPGARFPLEAARDPDIGTNSLQTYQLFPNEYFIVDVQTRHGKGMLPVLVLQKPLDRETMPNHELTLLAEDGGVPVRSGRLQVTIEVQDANDNIPVFSQSVYRVSLLESSPTGTLIITLNATDLDDGTNGEITYMISSHSSENVPELFRIDSKSGELRLKRRLDYEQCNFFEINVQAVDNGPYGIPQHCDVLVDVIDVNDNSPEITLSSSINTVSEDASVGTIVALLRVEDKDSGENGEVVCQIPSEVPFKLDSSMEKFSRLILQHLLDRETTSRYDITITCTDAGNPALTSRETVRVDISDINDNAPMFTQPMYMVNVMENNVRGASIFSMSAFDQDVGENARLNFSILPSLVENSSIASYITINSENGVLFAQRSFDYEQLKEFKVYVQVHDSGFPPLTSNASVHVAILDQNDNAPVIVNPLLKYGSTATDTISRFAEPGNLVIKVSATDADAGQNARLNYFIFEATHPNLFTISTGTGEIWTIRGFESKDASKQRLVVVVKDDGIPSLSGTVTIVLSVKGSETFSSATSLSKDRDFSPDLNFYLVIALGTTSLIFLVVLMILAVKVHKSRNCVGRQYNSPTLCWCFTTRNPLTGIQKASRNLQIPPNYVEVFGGDPLSQRFRYESCSTLQSVKGDFPSRQTCGQSAAMQYVQKKYVENKNAGTTKLEESNCSVNIEILPALRKDQNLDWWNIIEFLHQSGAEIRSVIRTAPFTTQQPHGRSDTDETG
ncbi:uncharacterized protein [Narcine bancroftii]|uniref:uncharacterized protein n=1 Tax=Narcine bancroftii TaxID=1343680 RepID=UPI003831C47A